MNQELPPSKAPRLLSASTGAQWAELSEAGSDEEAAGPSKSARDVLNRFSTEIILSENLVVLAGLGSTLYLNATGLTPPAPTMADVWAAVVAKAGATFASIQKQVKYPQEGAPDDIELLLSHCQLSQALEPSKDVADFIVLAETVVAAQCRFVTPTTNLDVHEAFLRKVARRSTRQPRCKVFTLNYDLCFETAASHTRFVVVDGFSHSQPQEFDGSHFAYDFVRREADRGIPDYIPNVFHLYKLHGSVDWERANNEVVKRSDTNKPLLIYPRQSKFEASYDHPFIELMSRFQTSLRQPNAGLLVIGFGFRDPHIWQPIISAVRANVGLKVLVVDPGLESNAAAPVKKMQALIRSGDSRIVLLGAGFEQFVPLIPEIVVDTEEERHRQRIRQADGT